MESFGTLLKAFVDSPLPAMLVCALVAVVWLARELLSRIDKSHAELTAALTAHLQTQTQLLSAIDVLDRLADRSP